MQFDLPYKSNDVIYFERLFVFNNLFFIILYIKVALDGSFCLFIPLLTFRQEVVGYSWKKNLRGFGEPKHQ